ncbi:hypothetical protein [Amycolatopsis sp. NPDC051061]
MAASMYNTTPPAKTISRWRTLLHDQIRERRRVPSSFVARVS